MSIPTNIVEGCGQKSDRDFARFLRYSSNSAAEFEYHTILGRDTRAVRDSDARSLIAQAIEIRRMLHGLITTVESTPERTPPRPDAVRARTPHGKVPSQCKLPA